MAAVRVTETKVGGFAALAIENEALGYTIVPALGAKLVSLRDRRTGHEWLWRNPRLPLRRVGRDASYVAAADTGGWDECFPSVSPCAYPLDPWRGAAIPDHGELWAQEAAVTVEHDATGGVAIRAAWTGVSMPYTFVRTLTLAPDGATLRAAYAVRNDADHDLACIWSAHPLIPLTAGLRLELPAGAMMHINAGTQGDAPAPGPQPWPPQTALCPFPDLPAPDSGVACKLWSEPLVEGWAELIGAAGRLHFSFDPALLPQIALWVNAGAWAGDGGTPYNNLGLEPCFGAQDSLADAVTRDRRYGILHPGETRTWWLDTTVSSGQSGRVSEVGE